MRLIYQSLKPIILTTKEQFLASKSQLFFCLETLLHEEILLAIYNQFPRLGKTVAKDSFREYKFNGYQMNKYDFL